MKSRVVCWCIFLVFGVFCQAHSAEELLPAARENGCDCMLLGEARFHTCLEAHASGIGLLLPGHFASERFAVESLAEVLSQRLPGLEVWPSREEQDPIRWV